MTPETRRSPGGPGITINTSVAIPITPKGITGTPGKARKRRTVVTRGPRRRRPLHIARRQADLNAARVTGGVVEAMCGQRLPVAAGSKPAKTGVACVPCIKAIVRERGE